MTWYAANLAKCILLKDDEQSDFPVFETTFIVEADSFEEAESKAIRIAEIEEKADENLTYCGKPAYSKFIGIRKIKKTHNLEQDNEIGSARPGDGTEVMSSYFEISGKDSLKDFADGKAVTVRYVDDDVS